MGHLKFAADLALSGIQSELLAGLVVCAGVCDEHGEDTVVEEFDYNGTVAFFSCPGLTSAKMQRTVLRKLQAALSQEFTIRMPPNELHPSTFAVKWVPVGHSGAPA